MQGNQKPERNRPPRPDQEVPRIIWEKELSRAEIETYRLTGKEES